jgi:hypothetical protein
LLAAKWGDSFPKEKDMTRMRRGVVASVVALAMAIPVDGVMAAGAERVQLVVTKGGVPDAGVEVALNAANLGKVALGTTDSQGGVSFALDAANLGKARVQVITDECPTRDHVWLVSPDGQMPPEAKDCKRRVAGAFFWGNTRLSVDVARGTVTATGEKPKGGSNKTLGIALLGVGGAVAIFGFATKSKEEGVTDCATEGPSACSTRTGVGIAGLVIAAAGGFVLYKSSRSSAEITFPGGRGFGIQQRIRF